MNWQYVRMIASDIIMTIIHILTSSDNSHAILQESYERAWCLKMNMIEMSWFISCKKNFCFDDNQLILKNN